MLKKLAIIFIAVFGVMLAVPTMIPGAAKYFPSWIGPIPLGLDLRGGAQLLLEVDTQTMFAEKANQLYDDARAALIDRDKGVIRFSNLRNNDGVVSLVVRDASDVAAAKGRLKSVLGTTVDIESDGRMINCPIRTSKRPKWHRTRWRAVLKSCGAVLMPWGPRNRLSRARAANTF